MLDGIKPSHITYFVGCRPWQEKSWGCGQGWSWLLKVIYMSLMLFCSCMLSVSLMLSVVKVNFTTMMGGLAQTNQVKEAAELFRLMLRKGIHVDFVSLYSILGVCAKRGKGCFFYQPKECNWLLGICMQKLGTWIVLRRFLLTWSQISKVLFLIFFVVTFISCWYLKITNGLNWKK